MHEYAVTRSILALALEAARNAGANRITAINLVLGDLSSIVDDSIQFYFDHLSPGTPAEGARLCFQRVPATLTCHECGTRRQVSPPLPSHCPVCGGQRLHVTGGTEFFMESVEVDDEGAGGHVDPEQQ